MAHLKPLLAALFAVTILSGCAAIGGGSSTTTTAVTEDDAVNGFVIRAPGVFMPQLFGI